ncbi:MAG: translation initiation factor, partial [Rhodoferax sp.]|nr:translation initiation factor [Rhodoferax sp.]
MSNSTVAEFAAELKKSADTLLEQLKGAGVAKSTSSDVLSESDKQKLLGYLQASHGTASAERKKITLVKKSTTEIKQADATGRARTIQVEVRKKRTFIKRDDEQGSSDVLAPEAEVVEMADTAEAPSGPSAEDLELSRREEEARRQAELIRRQEEELVEKRRQREEQETREQAVAESAAAERAAAYAAQTQKAQAQQSASVAKESADQAAAREAAVKAQADEREKAAVQSKARADEEAARAVDLGDRRRKAEAEAAAIRLMMATPKKVLVAKKPEEVKPVAKPVVADAKAGMKGTLHKPAAGTTVARPAVAGATTAPGGNKEVKSAKLSSSWADPAKKKPLPTRGDTGAGAGRGNWRGGPRGRRGNNNDHREDQSQQAPVENRVIEVHVPETITVAELA